MDGTEFRRLVKKLAKSRGTEYRYVPHRGKGSHGTVYLGDRKSVVKNGEIGKGLFNDMLKQLGLTKKDFFE